MAGSLQDFIYLFDTDLAPSGNSRGVIRTFDESNLRNIGYEPSRVPLPGPPSTLLKRLEPRYIYWQGVTSGGKTIRRRIPVLSTNNTYYQDGGLLTLNCLVGTTGEDITGYITGSIGEKKTFAPPDNRDTGLDDGSQP